MLNPKKERKMEIQENTYKEKILFHKESVSGSKALGYAVQGTIITGLLYLVSNINSSEPPLYLDFLHCINGIQHGCDNSVLHQGNCTWMWAVGGTRAKVNS